ncbi:DUF2541 family protein [Klebsiella oxytoca]
MWIYSDNENKRSVKKIAFSDNIINSSHIASRKISGMINSTNYNF